MPSGFVSSRLYSSRSFAPSRTCRCSRQLARQNTLHISGGGQFPRATAMPTYRPCCRSSFNDCMCRVSIRGHSGHVIGWPSGKVALCLLLQGGDWDCVNIPNATVVLENMFKLHRITPAKTCRIPEAQRRSASMFGGLPNIDTSTGAGPAAAPFSLGASLSSLLHKVAKKCCLSFSENLSNPPRLAHSSTLVVSFFRRCR